MDKPLSPFAIELLTVMADMNLHSSDEGARKYGAFLKQEANRLQQTTDVMCWRCGRKLIVSGTPDPLSQYVCDRCSTADTPDYKPDTAFGY